ncbi:MAG: hypothetical protein IKB71_01170 [Lentisphaeria bacterium]|nr:hypothetical protein [Lentisphaeria bacterium]
MPQLKMIINAKTTPMPELEVAEGFSLRNVLDEELEQYNELRTSVNFPAWDVETLKNYRNKVLPGGMMVIVENATGRFAASAGAETTDMKEFAHIGVLGWVMTHPDMRGHHLGKSASVAAMHRLYKEGYRTFSLLTDDFRDAALKTYLNLGWKPWLYLDDMEGRWRAIAEKLGRSFESLGCLPLENKFPEMEK